MADALTDAESWRLTSGRPVDEVRPRLFGRALDPADLRRPGRRRTALYHELADGRTAAVPGVAKFVQGLAAAGVPRALATSAVPGSESAHPSVK